MVKFTDMYLQVLKNNHVSEINDPVTVISIIGWNIYYLNISIFKETEKQITKDTSRLHNIKTERFVTSHYQLSEITIKLSLI